MAEIRASRRTRIAQGLSRTSTLISRPYDGISIKDDTHAVLSVVDSNNVNIPIMTQPISYGGFTPWEEEKGISTKTEDYSDFILQQVQDTRMEKKQVVETFGAAYVFFFGESPRLTTFAGVLLNTADYNWRSQFWFNYDNYLRGSKLVQLNAKAYVAYDTIVVGGYILDAQASDDANSPYSVPFQFSMFVTDYYDYSNVGGVSSAELLNVSRNPEEDNEKKYKLDASKSEFYRGLSPLITSVMQNNALLDADYRARLNSDIAEVRNAAKNAVKGLSKPLTAIHNFFNNAGGMVEGLGDQVAATQRIFSQLTSKAYPLALNAQNFIRDPELMVRNVLGVGVSSPSEFTRYGRNTTARRQEEAKGIRGSVVTAIAAARGGYIGRQAQQSFDEAAVAAEVAVSAGSARSVVVGSIYQQAAYTTIAVVEGKLNIVGHELGFDNKDYTAAVVAGGAEANRLLGDVYGDVEPSVVNDRLEVFEDALDAAKVTIDQGQSTAVAAVESTYETIVSNYSTVPERMSENLRQIQNDSIETAETIVEGIRGVDDDDAEIRPVI